MITKRVCELKKGDIFKMAGFIGTVIRVGDGKIYYRSNNSWNRISLGGKSQQKVELIEILPEAETIKEQRRTRAIYSNVRSLYAK